MKVLVPAAFLVLSLLPRVLPAADVFDRHTSYWLKQAAEDGKPLKSLAMEDSFKLKSLSKSISSPCIVVKTDEENWAKALLGWGFRKDRKTGERLPVLLIERFVTYRGDRGDVTAAAGKDVMLFAGFHFDFDIGQVVPQGQGGDVLFNDKPHLVPDGAAEVFALDGSQLPPADPSAQHDPTDHDGVLPRDFAGTWKINVDGRWKGDCRLTVEENGITQGRYTSDESKSTYPVAGRISGVAHRIKLQIELENARQTIDAYLWTTDKSIMAGSATLAGRTFGFYAVREKPAAKE